MSPDHKRFFGYYGRRPFFGCGQTVIIYPRLNINALLWSGVLRSGPRRELST